jgi:aspartate racemase
MEHVDTGHWEEAGQLLLQSARLLADAGARTLICPDNTLHQALDLVRGASPAPWVHIADEVAAVAAARRFTRLGILGTRYLMEGPVYRTALARVDIGCEIPDPASRERINGIIFDELVCGRVDDDARQHIQRVIAGLGERGCDAVVLGCTEIPLLISEADSRLPALDSTRILARAVLREATRGVSPPA